MTTFSKNPYTEVRKVINRLVFRKNLDQTLDRKFKHKQFSERFALANAAFIGMGLVATSASIYIAIEGAKLLPSLLVSDSIELAPELETNDAINEEYDTKIETLTKDRDAYVQTRLYQGRIRTEDSEEVMRYNKRIERAELKKDSVLQVLAVRNESLRQATSRENEAQKVSTNNERSELGDQLVFAAVGFEVLFLLSMCFSWWYYAECEKERQEFSNTAETPTDTGSTAKVEEDTLEVTEENLEVETIGARATKKISFRDYEDLDEAPTEMEKIKKDYTRICAHCSNPFIHKTHNHKYCSRACMVAAREKRNTNK